jgi:hypothetical protein
MARRTLFIGFANRLSNAWDRRRIDFATARPTYHAAVNTPRPGEFYGPSEGAYDSRDCVVSA